ncbi:MAG TPA: Rieske 2Fe-2S domain-containing protein [Candidatus Limnocylindria bacterium]|nr:Rieske 2Fe-2S domain-containing protein [Candidatus Limnocylindria bacterium]
MIARLVTRLIDAQAVWARPLGDFNHRWLTALFGRLRPLKDLLNGKWLGHPLHAVLTDVPVGVFTLAIVFDVLDLRLAADLAIALGILASLAAAVTGLADYTDTDGHPRMVATVHATLNSLALVAYIVSLALRTGNPDGDRLLAIVLSLVGYGLLSAGAWVGGEIVFALGNMVNRHAWRFSGSPGWVKLDLSEIPEGVLTRAKAGAQSLVLVREGSTILALHDTCAHAGGPLSQGRIVDGCVECPWHQSRFRLSDGRRVQGPTTFDQPRYEVRAAEGGGYEARRVGGTKGQNV